MRIREKLSKEIIPALSKQYETKYFAMPKIDKAVVTVGVGPFRDSKESLAAIEKELMLITGQKSSPSVAKKSIAGFKLREGQVVSYVITLRSARMWDFIERLITIVLPRMRDFDGIPVKSFDRNMNFTMSVREQTMFPEVKADEVKDVWGLGITFSIKNAKENPELTKEYLKQIGFIFKG